MQKGVKEASTASSVLNLALYNVNDVRSRGGNLRPKGADGARPTATTLIKKSVQWAEKYMNYISTL